MQISLTINGTDITEEIEPRVLLVHFIRDQLRLTGTHWGCDTSNCGACTLWVDGEAVKSCTVLAAQADGHEVTTVEGLEKGGELDPVQQGFIECHGLQCGFCTPGFLMAIEGLLAETPGPTDDEIVEGISGNLCRCTGYQNIIAAVRRAAELRGEEGGA